MKQLLKKYFGYEEFRPLQREIITHITEGKDTLVLMPTGGGKSVCYQLPALMMTGTAVVVSPLLSLMRDQVEALKANNIAAAALCSMNDDTENLIIRQECRRGELKLLYISPERVLAEAEGMLREMQISLFAIDEAHCISQWGHDFRPEYTQLGTLRERFPQVPVVALTATADKVTREDIAKQLHLREPKLFLASFDRPNLSLDVKRGFTRKEKNLAIVEFIQERAGSSGIVYCQSRKATEELAAVLQRAGIKATFYHAGMAAERRNNTQDDFINDRIPVVCATVAFGMGIDKSNVRWVIHYNLPKSIESFYQEIGRAGRDGLPGETLLFYSLEDLILLKKFAEESGQQEINKERLDRMQEYAESSICRRRILLSYFGEESSHDCGNCDVCRNPPLKFDGTVLVQKALSGIVRCEGKVGFRTLIDLLRGSLSQEVSEHGYHRLKTFGVGRDIPARDWKDYLLQMLQLGYLEIAYDDHNHLRVTEAGREVLFGRQTATLVTIDREERELLYNRKKRTAAKRTKEAKLFKSEPTPLNTRDTEQLFEALRALRKQLADEEVLPPYIVMSDKVLHLLCQHRPTSIEAFGEINGIGEYKKKKYGPQFIRLIQQFV